MRVSVSQIEKGTVIAKDVFSKTNHPIIKEKTVLTDAHIHILKTFLIREVEVERTMISGKQLSPPDEDANEKAIHSEDEEFNKMFFEATKSYEKEFRSWQSGMLVDVTKIRSFMLPLLKKMEEENVSVFLLHHYSTKDNYMYHHPIAVGLLSGYIAKRMNYSLGDTVQIALAGCLANCGMAKVNEKILHKKTALTREEFMEIKNHPILSLKMIEKTPFLKDEAKLAIYQHHERLDGSGYPHGEKGNKIHPFAKIIGVADVFHAMTSERLYKSKQSPFKVLEMMLEDHFGQFDLEVLQQLSNAIMTFSIGSKVQLSDGRIAEIMFIDQQSPSRPLVKVDETTEIIDLVQARQLYIQKVILND